MDEPERIALAEEKATLLITLYAKARDMMRLLRYDISPGAAFPDSIPDRELVRK
jgi:hypothetical protein